MSSLDADYLRDRGVLETTFAQYGGEPGNPRDTAMIAERLNREPAKVIRDPNWPAVEAILWFPIHGASGELVHWIAQATAEVWREQIRGADRFEWIALDTTGDIRGWPST